MIELLFFIRFVCDLATIFKSVNLTVLCQVAIFNAVYNYVNCQLVLEIKIYHSYRLVKSGVLCPRDPDHVFLLTCLRLHAYMTKCQIRRTQRRREHSPGM